MAVVTTCRFDTEVVPVLCSSSYTQLSLLLIVAISQKFFTVVVGFDSVCICVYIYVSRTTILSVCVCVYVCVYTSDIRTICIHAN